MALSCLLALPAQAKRVALVIGNDNYFQVSRLEKAGNDADSMAREFEAAGFEVKKHRDLTYKQMVSAFEAFYDRIKPGDEVAVFYAGHGVQTERGSHLLPTDIEGETQSQIEKISYSVNGLLEELDRVKPLFSLIIVDACRDNPLRSRGRSIGVSRGLSAPDAAKGQMVVFSAGRNQKALDSLSDKDTNPNGVFTREFIARMRRPGVSVEALALEVKSAVEQLASTVNHEQRPLIVNESTGNFYFFGPGSRPTVNIVQSAPAAAAAAAVSESAREDLFWQDTKAPDNIEGYEAYLVAYPNGRYAGLAKANLSRLRQALSPPSVVSARPSAPIVAPAPASVAPPVQPGLPAAGAPGGPAAQSGSPVAAQVRPAAQPSAAPASAAVVALAGAARRPGEAAKMQIRQNLSNGDRYEGEAIGAVRTGQGKYYFASGDRYEGELVDNEFTGKGTMTRANGEQFAGQYLRGIKQGPGVLTFANKDRFEGTFVDDLFDGKGVFIYANGDRYDGEFRRGIMHGRGVYRFTNGERYEGAYADNVYEGRGSYQFASGDRYEGDYRRGIKQGQGVYYFANGDRYEGSFLNNVFNGRGKLFLASKDRYEGDFRDNAQDGIGTHFFANGDRYEGAFRVGAQSGAGTHFYTNGDRYVGEFDKGVRHGKGVYHYPNGSQKEFEFVKGVEKSN